MSRRVGYVLSDQSMVPVKEKVHEKQSINEQLLCSVLVLAKYDKHHNSVLSNICSSFNLDKRYHLLTFCSDTRLSQFHL